MLILTPQALENSALAVAGVRLARVDHVSQKSKIGPQMDAIWERLEFASGQKGGPGGVQKKGQKAKGLRLILGGTGGCPEG